MPENKKQPFPLWKRLLICFISVEIALAVEQLCDQHSAAGGTAQRVVGKADELPVVNAILAQTAIIDWPGIEPGSSNLRLFLLN